MLILTRKLGQVIVIGDDEIAITVLSKDIHSDEISLGIRAPKEIYIRRGERKCKDQRIVSSPASAGVVIGVESLGSCGSENGIAIGVKALKNISL
jgi:carbon storage regulator CsrA